MHGRAVIPKELRPAWNIAVKDLETKRLTWESAATRIMETGLADFDKGFGKIKTEWTTWQDKYKEEYERLATAWDTSYAEMEAKKLSWVGRATRTA